MPPTDTLATITPTGLPSARLTWSATVAGRVVRMGSAQSIDGAIVAIVAAGVSRDCIAVEACGVRVAV